MKNLKINFIEKESTIVYEEYIFNGLQTPKNYNDFKGFTNEIIKTAEEANQILNWIDKTPNTSLKVEKLFTATLEENTSIDFHNKCDCKGPTIVLCEELKDGYRFGGYAKEEWELSGKVKYDKTSFLFSLDKNKKYIAQEGCYIYGGPNHGPHFGHVNLALIWGYHSKTDTFIGNNSFHFQNMNGTICYDIPKNELCGKENFQLRKMEEYRVIEEKLL